MNRMQNVKKVNKRRKKLSLKDLLMIVIVSTLFVGTLTFSKFSTTLTTNRSNTRVAVMSNDVSFSIEDTIKGYPGFSAEPYRIVLTNKENGKVCEVAQRFNIEMKIEGEENLPLEIGLYKDIACQNKLVDDDNDSVFESDDFRFLANQEGTKTYYLKINWPENKNSSNYFLELSYLKINFVITQVD